MNVGADLGDWDKLNPEYLPYSVGTPDSCFLVLENRQPGVLTGPRS